MHLLIILLVLGGTLSACASARQEVPVEPAPLAGAAVVDETPGTVQRPGLREELRAMRDADQAVRAPLIAAYQAGSQPDSVVIAEMAAVDAANLARLKQIVRAYGWPDRRMVGADGVDAVWLLVQHADSDLAFQREYLEWMEPAFHAGELSSEGGQHLALLTDRVRINEGRPQLYGTQLEFTPDGSLVVKPIEDEANVDARRAALGLPSLADYLALVRQLYATPR